MYVPGKRLVADKANKHFTLTKGELLKGDTAVDPSKVRKPELSAGKPGENIGQAPGANVTTPGKTPNTKQSGNQQSGTEVTDEEIKAVLLGMDHDTDGQWTADGKPLMTHVESMLGVNITRKRLEASLPGFARGMTTLAQAGSQQPPKEFLG